MTRADAPVVVVGAGLSGLACARELRSAGVDCVILEAAATVGGRAYSDDLDGFTLDRGFQVYLPAYPEGRRVLDLDGLDLRPFYPGALVRVGGRFERVAHPLRRPLQSLGALRGSVFTVGDAMRVVNLLWQVRGGLFDGDLTTRQLLDRCGFSDGAVDRFFRPFFGGVFLERELSTPAAMFAFVFDKFARAGAALPAEGMRAIADQLARAIPEGGLRLGARVSELSERAVVLEGGARVEAAAVVVATDFGDASQLTGAGESLSWNGALTMYFSCERSPLDEAILVLNGDEEGPVSHVCIPSDVAPSYAPAGAALVSVSLHASAEEADGDLEAAVRAQLGSWFGDGVGTWRQLATYRIPRALPADRYLDDRGTRERVRVRERLYRCGDYLASPSIDGALRSGAAAAQALLEDRS